MKWSSRASATTSCAMALALAIAPIALASRHTETLVAFDAAQGQLPEGVAVDAKGNIYASLTTLGELVRVPAGASEAEPFGRIEGLAEGDFGPAGLAVDAEGDIYGGVMSQNPEANGVWHFDGTTGAADRIAGSEGIAFANDVALADDGTLYITDTTTGAVWRAPPGGAAQLWAQDELLEGTGEAGFGFPIGANGIAVDGDTVFVGVTERAHVAAIPIASDGSAGEIAIFAQLPEAVDGIAIDAAGNLISAHPLANLVTRRTPDGELEVIAQEADGLDRPSTIALRVDEDGSTTAYVANFSVALGTPLGSGPSIMALDLGATEPAAGDAATPSVADAPHAVTVVAMGRRFDPAEFTISSVGSTTLVLVNEGQVIHNLVVDELGLFVSAAPGVPGEVTLADPPPGTYTFYCAIYGHRLAGMVGTLTVE